MNRRLFPRLLISGFILTAVLACSNRPMHVDKSTGVDSPAAINVKLGVSYMQHENYEVALEKFKKALDEEPKLVEAHHYIAELYRRTGEVELAKKHFRRALQLDDKDTVLQHDFGVFLCQQGDFDEAEKRMLVAARDRHYARPEVAYQNAGLCMMRKPDLAAAERDFRAALKINKELPVVLYQMALISHKTQRDLNGRAFLQRYAAIARHTAATLWLGVQIERELGDKQESENYAEALRRDFPDTEEEKQLRALFQAEQ